MSRLKKKHNLVGWLEWSLHDLSVHQIFCIVLATQLLDTEATTCNSWEYQNHENCCPKCGIGFRVSKHCTDELGTNCLPCTEGTYTDHPNGLTECLRCHSCDPGAHLRIKEACTYTKNTVCSCSQGYFCIHSGDGGCELCQKHKVSPPGSMVVQPGTETSDAEVVRCPPKTFSASENASSCRPWTNCSEKGLLEKRAGNSTSDAICAAHQGSNTTIVAVFASLMALGLFVFGIVVYLKCWKSNREANTGKQQEAYGDYLPVQESIKIQTPMQETAQNPGEPSYAPT